MFQPRSIDPQTRSPHLRAFPALTLLPIFLTALSAPLQAQETAPSTPTITVNVFNERHQISPYIYGGNFPKDSEFIRTTGTRLSRWGGNDATSYNWKLHLKNICADWFFENFSDDDTIDWVKKVQEAGSAAVVGIAMVDWTPKAAGEYSFSVAKYGPQQKTDPERPDDGNGMAPDGKTKIQNDPNDAYVPLRDWPSPGDAPGTVYRSEWIEQLRGAFGTHPHLYEFDNEPEIWNGTHRDIHPQPVTYAEMRDKYLDMAHLIKTIDPVAKIMGPVTCGWWFYWNSAAGPADKAAHGGVDYLPWWLGQIADADQKSGNRTLDYFEIHAYPDFNSKGSPDVVDGSRLRASRGYWDPNFRSEGGISTQGSATATQPDTPDPAIITRFRAMVNAIYPGTGFGITEWNYWDEKGIASSLADADTYGVFGREKLDLATRFCSPDPGTPSSLALQMYKDFAPISVEDRTNVDIDLFTSYAALSADGKQLTVMTINKDPKNSVLANIKLAGFKPATMAAYERAGDGTSIAAIPPISTPASYTFKPYSQTLLVFDGTTTPGVVDWSIDKDALMMVTGSQAVLSVSTGNKHSGINIETIDAQAGVTMTVQQPRVYLGHPGTIAVTAGSDPGFYHFTVTGKTSSGRVETQSGWIVVGAPGSLPVRQ